MRERLDQLAHRLTEIDALLSQPEMAEDLDGFRKLSLERAEVEPVVLAYNAYRQAEETMADAKILMDDAEMRDLAQEEYETAQAEHQQLSEDLRILLLPKNPDDNRSAFLEIRAGTGGEIGRAHV